MVRSLIRFAAARVVANRIAALHMAQRSPRVAAIVLIASLLTATACQRSGDSGLGQTLMPPNPELNFRVLSSEPCTGCREFREPGNPVVYYGLPRRAIVAADIAGVRLSDDQYLGSAIEVRFKPGTDAKILAMSESNMGKPMAVMLGDRPLRISYIRGAFSGSVQMTGYSQEQRQALFRDMTSGVGQTPGQTPSN